MVPGFKKAIEPIQMWFLNQGRCVGGAGVFLSGFVHEHFHRRDVVWKEQRALGKDIRDIVSEGIRSGFVIGPKNLEHNGDVALRLEEHDEELAFSLRQYLRIWKQMSEQVENIVASKALRMTNVEWVKLQRDAFVLEGKLLEGAKLLRTPHGTWLMLKSKTKKLARKIRKAGK